MAKLLIRKTPDTTKPWEKSEYLDWRTSYGSIFQGIELPTPAVLGALYDVMTEVQRRIRPVSTWIVTDSWLQHYITIQWASPTTQFRLEFYANPLGLHGWLYDHFACPPSDNLPWVQRVQMADQRPPLASWRVTREHEHNSFYTSKDEYGNLRIYRLVPEPLKSVDLSTHLSLFEGITRYGRGKPSWEPEAPDLIDDIVEFTQKELIAAGIAT